MWLPFLHAYKLSKNIKNKFVVEHVCFPTDFLVWLMVNQYGRVEWCRSTCIWLIPEAETTYQKDEGKTVPEINVRSWLALHARMSIYIYTGGVVCVVCAVAVVCASEAPLKSGTLVRLREACQIKTVRHVTFSLLVSFRAIIPCIIKNIQTLIHCKKQSFLELCRLQLPSARSDFDLPFVMRSIQLHWRRHAYQSEIRNRNARSDHGARNQVSRC